MILPPDVVTPPETLVNLRAEVAAIVKQNIRQILIDMLADKLGHAYAVASGEGHFRRVFLHAMGAFWGSNRTDADHVANAIYRFAVQAWRHRYPNENAFTFLDAVHVASPESQAEFEKAVEDAWEVEIAGSEEGMARHYYGSARVRKGRDIFSTFWQRAPQKPQ